MMTPSKEEKVLGQMTANNGKIGIFRVQSQEYILRSPLIFYIQK